jgi:hypothetical protein
VWTAIWILDVIVYILNTPEHLKTSGNGRPNVPTPTSNTEVWRSTGRPTSVLVKIDRHAGRPFRGFFDAFPRPRHVQSRASNRTWTFPRSTRTAGCLRFDAATFSFHARVLQTFFTWYFYLSDLDLQDRSDPTDWKGSMAPHSSLSKLHNFPPLPELGDPNVFHTTPTHPGRRSLAGQLQMGLLKNIIGDTPEHLLPTFRKHHFYGYLLIEFQSEISTFTKKSYTELHCALYMVKILHLNSVQDVFWSLVKRVQKSRRHPQPFWYGMW